MTDNNSQNKDFNNNKGQVPIINNTLDYNMYLIKPDWKEANPTFTKNADNVRYISVEGEDYINVNDILTNMDFYTQDIRLSNYSREDVKQVRWWLRYAGACAGYRYFKAFNFCLNQVANLSETSQGQGGFLRKILNTFTQEQISKVMEPPKRSFLTGKHKEQNEGGQ